jgi:hypothetical protein
MLPWDFPQGQPCAFVLQPDALESSELVFIIKESWVPISTNKSEELVYGKISPVLFKSM